MDGRTDTPSYRNATAHLKIDRSLKFGGKNSHAIHQHFFGAFQSLFAALRNNTPRDNTRRRSEATYLSSGAGPKANIIDEARNFGADQTRVRRRLV